MKLSHVWETWVEPSENSLSLRTKSKRTPRKFNLFCGSFLFSFYGKNSRASRKRNRSSPISKYSGWERKSMGNFMAEKNRDYRDYVFCHDPRILVSRKYWATSQCYSSNSRIFTFYSLDELDEEMVSKK